MQGVNVTESLVQLNYLVQLKG